MVEQLPCPGDIYANGSARHAGDLHTPGVIGDMYSGLWAGCMITGAA